MAKKRFFKRKEKDVPKGYDSILEYDLHNGPLMRFFREGRTVKYTVDHEYTPDFWNPHFSNVLVEVKGRFRDSTEASKYKWIRECNPHLEIVFVFEKRNTKFPFAKKRKDGSFMTHEEWAEKNGFRYYFPDNLPKEWSDATNSPI